MATIKAMLRTVKDTGYAPIVFRVSDGRSKLYRWISPIQMDVELWDNVREQVKSRKVCNEIWRAEVNKRISETKTLVSQVYSSHKSEIHSSEDLGKFVEATLHPESSEDKLDALDALQLFIDSRSENLSRSSIDSYKNLGRELVRYFAFLKLSENREEHWDIHTLTLRQLNDFISYVEHEKELLEEYPDFLVKMTKAYPKHWGSNLRRSYARSVNSMVKSKRLLRAWLGWLFENEYTENTRYLKVNVGREVRVEPLTFSLDEARTIARFNLSDWPRLAVQRDILLFQFLTGMRVGDMEHLTGQCIREGVLEYIPIKTAKNTLKTVRVPLHPRAQEIIERYGRLGTSRPLLPCSTQQHYGKAIKSIFTLCKLNRPVRVMNVNDIVEKPLADAVTSHAARRSFCSILASFGVGSDLIDSLVGHTIKGVNAHYINLTDELNKKRKAINLIKL